MDVAGGGWWLEAAARGWTWLDVIGSVILLHSLSLLSKQSEYRYSDVSHGTKRNLYDGICCVHPNTLWTSEYL